MEDFPEHVQRSFYEQTGGLSIWGVLGGTIPVHKVAELEFSFPAPPRPAALPRFREEPQVTVTPRAVPEADVDMSKVLAAVGMSAVRRPPKTAPSPLVPKKSLWCNARLRFCRLCTRK